MNNFSVKTKIFMGIKEFEEELKNLKRVFVVTDKFLHESGKISYITDKLDANNAQYEIFSDVTPDPDISLISLGVEMIAKFNPDAIITMGGGSAIDAAKGISYFAKKTTGLKHCLFIAIPTTSGTGSEMTRFSIISNNEKHIKYPLIDESLLPDIAVLDPYLIMSVPPAVTADTGIDVITHAIEAYVSTDASDFSDAVAEKAFKLAVKYLPIAYKNPNDYGARKAMHHASTLAGIAFDNASLGLNHGMAHILGARAKLPHGRANAILLPDVIEFNAELSSDRNAKPTIAAERYAELANIIGVGAGSVRQSVINLVKHLKNLIAELSVPNSIKDAGVDEKVFMDSIAEMSKIALADRCTDTNPRKCTEKEIENVFIKAYRGKSI